MLSLVYGYETAEEEDRILGLTQEGQRLVSTSFLPGARMVSDVPWCMVYFFRFLGRTASSDFHRAACSAIHAQLVPWNRLQRTVKRCRMSSSAVLMGW